MKMFCFTSVRRLGLPVAVAGLTADRAKCNPHFCCCSTRQTRTWVQSLRSELTRRRLCIGWNWLQDRRERRRVTTMARESDFNWEDDLMTKWVISLLSLFCGISLSVEQHIYLKQPTNTNKLRSTTNKQTNNQRYHGQELPEAGVPPFKAGKVSRARLRKTETRLGVRETEHCLSGQQWGYCADLDIFFLHIFLLLKSEHCFIVQKEVIKECVHMCQMVAQFGTRWTCVFVFLYLYIWICVFVFAIFVLCIVQTSIKFPFSHLLTVVIMTKWVNTSKQSCMEIKCRTRQQNQRYQQWYSIYQTIKNWVQLLDTKDSGNIGNSWYECSAHSAEPPAQVGHGKGLPLPPPPLVQHHRLLPSLCCCPCTRPKLCQPLQQAKPLASHHCHTEAPPDLPHDLPQQTWSRLLPLRPAHCCNSRLRKEF